MESKFRDVDGVRMRWEEEGTGRPVVFVHGVPTGPRLWRHVIPRVEGARSLAWEMVGYGASIDQGAGRDISVAAQAGYLSAWLRALGLGRAVLVGHDLGGGVAQIVAVRAPELVGGLVLTNAIAYDSWPIPSVRAMRAVGSLVARLPNALFRPVFRAFLHLGHDDRRCAEAALRAHWPPYAAAGGAAALIRQARSLHTRDTLAIAARLPRLDVRARLVWGAADQWQRIEWGERLAHDLRAPLDRVEGGKHYVPEDHAGRVAAAVGALLRETAGGSDAVE